MKKDITYTVPVPCCSKQLCEGIERPFTVARYRQRHGSKWILTPTHSLLKIA